MQDVMEWMMLRKQSSQKMLKKLEMMYIVTQFEMDTEYDEWDDSKAHVTYSFREKFED